MRPYTVLFVEQLDPDETVFAFACQADDAEHAREQPAASSETVNVIGMPEFDGLLDHIYEHGTAAEGVIEKANAFARAVIARYAPQQPEASTTLNEAESHARICAKLAEEHKDDVLFAALTDAAAIIRDLMRDRLSASGQSGEEGMRRDEIIALAREQGLPETETEGVFRVNADDLGRMLAAALAAHRKQGDEQ